MTWTAYLLAVLALLVAPGPTNTLLFLAGVERGWRGALRLIPVALAGYLAVAVPLSIFGAQAVAALPVAKPVISVAAGVWIGVLAWRLWGLPVPGGPQRRISARGVLVTTLLNPKGLVFGLVLIPAAPALPVAVAALAGQIMVITAGWAAAGAMAGYTAAGPEGAPTRRVVWVRRASALWLGALSVGLLVRGLSA